jgi:hypothetical protein
LKDLGKKYIIILILLISVNLSAQSISKSDNQSYEIEVEQFMGMLDGIYSDNLIDEMSYNLPENITIYNYAIGDFSGDRYLDLAISYKDNTCPSKTFKVILLVNVSNSTFKNVLDFEAKWRDSPFDVGFSISKSIVNITYRVNKYWVFSSYTYQDDKLKLIREEMY